MSVLEPLRGVLTERDHAQFGTDPSASVHRDLYFGQCRQGVGLEAERTERERLSVDFVGGLPIAGLASTNIAEVAPFIRPNHGASVEPVAPALAVHPPSPRGQWWRIESCDPRGERRECGAHE